MQECKAGATILQEYKAGSFERSKIDIAASQFSLIQIKKN